MEDTLIQEDRRSLTETLAHAHTGALVHGPETDKWTKTDGKS